SLISSPVRTCSGDTASPRSAATSAISGPPAEEAEELDLRVGIRRRFDFRPEAAGLAQRFVVRLEALEQDGGDLGAESFVAAGGAGEVPGVHVEIRQPGDERHLDRYFSSLHALDRPVEHAGLAQGTER